MPLIIVAILVFGLVGITVGTFLFLFIATFFI